MSVPPAAPGQRAPSAPELRSARAGRRAGRRRGPKGATLMARRTRGSGKQGKRKEGRDVQTQGNEIKEFILTSVTKGDLPFCMGVGLWEALSFVSQKWSFPNALS